MATANKIRQSKDKKSQVEIIREGQGIFVRRSKNSKYIVEYNRRKCIGITTCAAIASNTFRMDERNKAVLINEEKDDDDDIILAAAQSCPAFAIVIKDAETGEQIFPVDKE